MRSKSNVALTKRSKIYSSQYGLHLKYTYTCPTFKVSSYIRDMCINSDLTSFVEISTVIITVMGTATTSTFSEYE